MRRIIRKILCGFGILAAVAAALVGVVAFAYSYSIRNVKSAPKRVYDSAEAFEQDLNDGFDLRGVKVTFTVRDVKRDTPLGMNIWGGEHLNFYAGSIPDVAVGDVITVSVRHITRFPTQSYMVVCRVVEEK